MTTVEIDRIVDDYLRRLDAAAAALPAGRRAELVADIREHIDTALHDQRGAGTELDVRNVLERLGPPEDIVAAAVQRGDVAPVAGTSGVFEIIALVVLTVGGFVLPVVGYLAGAVLVLASKGWSTREKQIGLLAPFAILYLPFLLLALLGGVFGGSGMNLGVTEVMLLPFVFGGLAGLVGSIYLAVRLRARRG